MKHLLALAPLLLATPGLAAVPQLVPSQDVTVEYTIKPRDRLPMQAQVAIQAGGHRLRIIPQDLATTIIVDRGARTATLLVPLLKAYATFSIGSDREEEDLLHGQFEQKGTETVAGLPCTVWAVRFSEGRAEGCVTESGVILRGSAIDKHGPVGSITASSISFGHLPAWYFIKPEGYRPGGGLLP